jgi:hypothetical protein
MLIDRCTAKNKESKISIRANRGRGHWLPKCAMEDLMRQEGSTRQPTAHQLLATCGTQPGPRWPPLQTLSCRMSKQTYYGNQGVYVLFAVSDQNQT